MEATILLDHGMTFVGTADSGFAITMGTEREVGGDDDGARPLELMLMSLGGCTAMDVISILRKKRQEVSRFEVQVKAERADQHPKVFTKIVVHYVLAGVNISAEAVERAIELSATRYCPANAMLTVAVPIEHTYEIVG
ncbi:MAG: OsmC family protein [Chloroflexi bacterium]|nr:OsmC family protein [Chloroflexota bacterium]MDA0241866.1 OsmC family protein [Chloroflexota bacterium]